MQICSSCGGENPEGFRHCGHCGAPLTAPAVERRKLATLVFCDMTGSTAMGERVDAETVQSLMLSYFHEMRGALERHGGTVEKFVGDAVLAVFGVPEAHEDDALRGCRAALEMQARLGALNEELERRYGTRVALRIGVNTGEVVARDATSRETFVTGDAVNVAARLEQAAAPGEVLIGEPTYRLVRDAVTVEAVEPLVAKGKSEPVVAYRLLEIGGPIERRASPLVGREDELARLEREFDAVFARSCCRLVTVVGEPGVGKSRLAAELVDRVGSRARVTRGACLSYGEGITFWAIGQIVRDLAGIRDEHSVAQARSQLDGMLEGVESGPAMAARVAQVVGLADGSANAAQIGKAITVFLSAAAGGRPLLVLVDDIHWAEPALLDLLAGLPSMLAATPLLLVCLARPELTELRPEWPAAVNLEPLGEGDVDALLEELDAPAAARERISRVAAGNPLFAEELVAWAREGGDLDEMPTSLNALLGARLDRLDAGARDALERGAVEGEVFHRGAVVELSDDQARPQVPDGLEQLTGKDMIRPAPPSFAGEIAFRFKHILVRDAAYRATAKKLRASLHEHFADWLERLVGERVGEYEEILGYHFEQAYRYRSELGPVDDHAGVLAARAARHLGAAGRRATDRADVYAGAGLLGRATSLFPPDSLERLELMLAYSHALVQSGRPLEADAVSREQYERATALGERRLAADGRAQHLGVTIFADPWIDLDEAQAAYEEGIEVYAELGDEAGLARNERGLATVCRIRGREADAAALLERALGRAERGGVQFTRRVVAQSLAMSLPDGPMPVVDAIRRGEELRESSRDDRNLEATITRCLSALYAMAGRFDDARAYERRSSRVLDAANAPSFSYRSLVHSVTAKELAGDHAAARRDLEAQWVHYRDNLGGAPDVRGMRAAYELANLYCDDGRWEDAEECLAFHRDIPAPAHVIQAAYRFAAAARVEAHRGAFADALTHARRAVEIAETTDRTNMRAVMWLALAEVQRARGETAEADAAVATALALYEQKGNVAAAAALRACVAT